VLDEVKNLTYMYHLPEDQYALSLIPEILTKYLLAEFFPIVFCRILL